MTICDIASHCVPDIVDNGTTSKDEKATDTSFLQDPSPI